MSEYSQDYGRGMSTPAVAGTTGMMSFILGAAIGAGIALLLAPATGTETRRRLGQTANRLGTNLKSGMNRVQEHVGDLKEDVRTAVSSGRDAFARERDTRTDSVTPSAR